MSSIDRVVSNSLQAFLANSNTSPTPRYRLCVLTCMDSRIDIFKLLGLHPGDAHVLRNAGGRVTDDVVRSVALSQAVMGTEEVLVLHHTDCAMTRLSEDEAVQRLANVAGRAPDFEMLTIADDQAGVREDLAKLRASEFLLHRDQVRGFIYDIERGRVDEVT